MTGAKNIKKKSVKVTWKKVAKAKSYQIQYAMNNKFTKKAKIKKTKKLTYTVKKLRKIKSITLESELFRMVLTENGQRQRK